MPIPVTCSCGSSFAAPDHLAGKTVACPKCKSGLSIPAAEASGGGNSIFDDAGMQGLASDQIYCPSCEAVIASTAVLCVKCGYHIKLGKKMQAAKVASSGGHGDGHAATAEDMLEKAREAIAADKESKKREMEEGTSLWMIVLMFVYATSFLLLMLWLPGSRAFLAGGGMLVLTAVVGVSYCVVRIAMIGFEQNLLHGLMSVLLFVVYPIMKWDKCGPFYISMLSAAGVGLLGAGMIMLGLWLRGEEAKEEQFGGESSQVWPMEEATAPTRLSYHAVNRPASFAVPS
jgi:hypothetical protein